MRRRSFFKTIGSNLVLSLVPKWCRRAEAQTPTHAASLLDVAEVVLPSSLGADGIANVSKGFETWLSAFPAGADAGYGYGYPKPTVLGANPSAHYAEQLRELDAASPGGSFARLSVAERRGVVKSALAKAGAATIPPRPNGIHVGTDVMSYFYSSSDGKDFCYDGAIRESDCRGFGTAAERPARLS